MEGEEEDLFFFFGVIISLPHSWIEMEENMDILHHTILISTVLNCITSFNALNFFFIIIYNSIDIRV